mmetsp:Transcript_9091/g.55392  ORF Transcript_9091/g.55392 Transcript_9091/m.55392 type:complete len:264 (-) Transcript_9091:681-1472(-)
MLYYVGDSRAHRCPCRRNQLRIWIRCRGGDLVLHHKLVQLANETHVACRKLPVLCGQEPVQQTVQEIPAQARPAAALKEREGRTEVAWRGLHACFKVCWYDPLKWPLTHPIHPIQNLIWTPVQHQRLQDWCHEQLLLRQQIEGILPFRFPLKREQTFPILARPVALWRVCCVQKSFLSQNCFQRIGLEVQRKQRDLAPSNLPIVGRVFDGLRGIIPRVEQHGFWVELVDFRRLSWDGHHGVCHQERLGGFVKHSHFHERGFGC